MVPTRRETLLGLSSAALTSGALATVVSCSTRPEAKAIARVALLSPLTGERAQLGKAIERAARLSASADLTLRVFDTRGSVEGARDAAKRAGGFQPQIIIGPASSDEARAVAGAAPVLTLSNDESLQSAGLFVMGVTATQSTGAVLAYARQAGVRTVGVIRSGSDWSARCEAAALAIAGKAGLRIIASIDLTAGDAVEALRAAGGGELPNAVLLPDGGPALEGLVGAVRAAGLQMLGTSAWSLSDIALPAAKGAWIAAADPEAAARFVGAYQGQFGEAPGMIAGLAHDAMLASATLARARRLSRDGLRRPEGFSGVTGIFRFTGQTQTERRLAILVASPDGARPVDGEAMQWT